MPITPNDILTKEFNREFRGYAKEEVNEFLDEVVVDYERSLDQLAGLKRKLAEAEEKIKNFEKLQESLNSSILIANEAAERLKQNARKQNSLFMRQNASLIVSLLMHMIPSITWLMKWNSYVIMDATFSSKCNAC